MKQWKKKVKYIVTAAFAALMVCNVLSIPLFSNAETINLSSDISQETSVYYVSGTYGQDTNSGTADAPLKTLQKALEAAEDSSIIYILDDIVVQHADGSDQPLTISKAITIKGISDTGTLPVISLRTGGIILGTDVTFQNIQLGTGGFLRPGIAANGHTLRLVNVQENTQNLRPLQIYGGTFFEYSADGFGKGTDYGKEIRGTAGSIIIEDGSYDAVYAGSVNGDVDIPINISVTKENNLKLTKGIYAGSTVKDPQNINTSGEIPALDERIEISGTVNIEIHDFNHSGTVVDGVNEDHDVNLSVSGTGMYSLIVNSLDCLTVEQGTFVPASESSFGTAENNIPNVELLGNSGNKATLDLSKFVTENSGITVNDFTGTEHSILILASDGTLAIDGVLSGKDIEFRASGNGISADYWRSEQQPGCSGWIEYGVKYIYSSKGDGTFVITNPYVTQDAVKFTEDSNVQNGWTIDVMAVCLEEFSLFSEKVLQDEFNAWGCVISMEASFSEDSEQNLSFVPFDYKVKYTDTEGKTTEYAEQSSEADGGYYFCDYRLAADNEEILLSFEPVSYEEVDEEDNFYMKHMLYVDKGSNDLQPGTYEIALTAETASGTMTKSFILEIVSDTMKDEESGDQNEDKFDTEDVYRVSGASRYETSYKTADVLKQQLGVDKFDTAIIAYGKNFPDALAGSYLAGKTNAPILMISDKYSDELTAYVKENVEKGGTLYILGGEGVIPEVQLSGLKEYDICRLAGKTRYETNLRILEEAGAANEDILVCTGKNFADSLSASATGNPILLVNNKELTAAQKEFLEAHSGNKYYIIGGTGAVSARMEAMISEYGPTERISGKSRYETSVKIAEEFLEHASAAVLASAKNFPDGLCGGPLAYCINAPLILSADGKTDVVQQYTESGKIYKGYVLGGSKLISDDAVRTIFCKNNDYAVVAY